MHDTSTTLVPAETLRQISEPLPELYQKLTTRRDNLLAEAEALMQRSEEAGRKAVAVFDFAKALKIDLTAAPEAAAPVQPDAAAPVTKTAKPPPKPEQIPKGASSKPTPLTYHDLELFIANETEKADQYTKDVGGALGASDLIMVVHRQWPNRTIDYECFGHICEKLGRAPLKHGTWRKALLPLFRQNKLRRIEIKPTAKKGGRSTFLYYHA